MKRIVCVANAYVSFQVENRALMHSYSPKEEKCHF